MGDIPEDIKQRLALTAARFKVKYNIDYDDLVEFMQDIMTIVSDALDAKLDTEEKKDDRT